MPEQGPSRKVLKAVRKRCRFGNMHGHPATVAVFLTENRGKFTFPDGKTEERSWNAGESLFIAAEEHLPENLTDKALELILVELKA